MMQDRPRYKILVVLGIVFVVAAGFFLYTKYGYQNQDNNTMAVYNEKYQGAQAFQNSGDYSGALDAFNALLKSVPDKASEGKVKIFIAANLFARNQGDDQAKSIAMYKEVWNDPLVPAYVRAKVLTDLAGVVIRSKDESFYTSHFNEPPFSDFLPASGTSSSKMSIVYLKILELSDETFPNSYAEYLIAGNYYAPLSANDIPVGTATPEQVAKIMQDYVKKADILAPTDESTYKPEIIVQRYLYRSIALNGSNRILKNISLAEREDALKLALSKGAPYENGNDYATKAVIMDVRFFYAQFLNRNIGKERYSDIVTLLKPFGGAVSGSDPSFKATRARFMDLVTRSDTDFKKVNALALAQISPEFKDFLTSLGLKP
ncbi:hypothetical protein A2935_04105 [Candidatus Wolfebacteria bacterium RIFCSPLOWO2_01_FULL_47_17b]|uniref:Uncharacterized protein n=1 Tax=Candidatus Wolfebacteria bacterium RIFCSPLOWO2_01_FULL_47_17b TaxID=1802558 RepID=A0A1F8DZ25_9BACT|nr:MAG: hypothetical protein A2935_04105 [Candidatus Wolfebacteria bacterium RIFCSPLOWO2_01_FULL_47_17b]